MTGTEILLEIALPRRPARWQQPASIAADSASVGCCCPGATKMPSYGSDAKPKANHEVAASRCFCQDTPTCLLCGRSTKCQYACSGRAKWRKLPPAVP